MKTRTSRTVLQLLWAIYIVKYFPIAHLVGNIEYCSVMEKWTI